MRTTSFLCCRKETYKATGRMNVEERRDVRCIGSRDCIFSQVRTPFRLLDRQNTNVCTSNCLCTSNVIFSYRPCILFFWTKASCVTVTNIILQTARNGFARPVNLMCGYTKQNVWIKDDDDTSEVFGTFWCHKVASRLVSIHFSKSFALYSQNRIAKSHCLLCAKTFSIQKKL